MGSLSQGALDMEAKLFIYQELPEGSLSITPPGHTRTELQPGGLQPACPPQPTPHDTHTHTHILAWLRGVSPLKLFLWFLEIRVYRGWWRLRGTDRKRRGGSEEGSRKTTGWRTDGESVVSRSLPFPGCL